MEIATTYDLAPITLPNWVQNAYPLVPMDVQALQVESRQSLSRIFEELNRWHGGALFIPAGIPATVWQCDENNDFWGQYSPWIYTETPNRSMKATIDGPVVGWFQGAIDPRVERPEPIYHPDDKDIPISQTEAVFFFRVRFVKTKARMVKSKLENAKGEKLLVEDPIASAQEPRAVVTVGCTA